MEAKFKQILPQSFMEEEGEAPEVLIKVFFLQKETLCMFVLYSKSMCIFNIYL